MKKIKILLVEDEAIAAMDMKANLLDLGYEVPAVVASGEEAILAATRERPDLILMDIKLDGPMSGIEAADAIWKKQTSPLIRIEPRSLT